MHKKAFTFIILAVWAMAALGAITQYNAALMKRQLERCAADTPAGVSIATIVNGRDTVVIGDSLLVLEKAMYFDRLFRGTGISSEERDSILVSLIGNTDGCATQTMQTIGANHTTDGENRLAKPLRAHKAVIAHAIDDSHGIGDAGIVLFKGQYYAIAVNVAGDSLSAEDKDAVIAEISEVAFNNVMLGAPKLTKKRGRDPYKLGYDDGWDAGYEDGCYRLGWMTNWYTDDYRGSNREAYLQGYKEGYRDGFEEGFEDYEWEPGDDPDPDWEY